MKSAKSNKSLRSIKSTRSMKSIRTNIESRKGDFGGEVLNFGNILPMACAKFQCPYTIIVKNESQRDEFYKTLKHGETATKRKKLSIMPPQAIVASPQSYRKTSKGSKSVEVEPSINVNTLTISAIYDTYNCLSEILFSSMKVPRVLMQVMGLLVPYFQNLTTLTFRRCRIDAYTLYEISKMLDLSSITVICLDGSPVLEENYEMILSEKSNLRNLSLCKCKINDDACKLIAAKLHIGASAENLQLLNLSSNHITDIGAKYFSDALRTNRRLRYLNLADNRITDYGADHILGILIEFPVTCDEIMNMRVRYVKYLKCKQALYLKYLNECDTTSFDEYSQYSRKSSGKKKKSTRKDKEFAKRLNSDEDLKGRAELLVSEILGQFVDPFDSSSLKHYNNYYYCVGNMTLSYINLSYNNLTFLTIKKLLNVVMYQNIMNKSNQSGVTKVVVDGNNLPMCKELVLLNELFGRNIKKMAGKFDFSKRRISRIIKTGQ